MVGKWGKINVTEHLEDEKKEVGLKKYLNGVLVFEGREEEWMLTTIDSKAQGCSPSQKAIRLDCWARSPHSLNEWCQQWVYRALGRLKTLEMCLLVWEQAATREWKWMQSLIYWPYMTPISPFLSTLTTVALKETDDEWWDLRPYVPIWVYQGTLGRRRNLTVWHCWI